MNDLENTPPRLATHLLSRLLRDDLKEEILGDLEEKFHAVTKEKSIARAKLNYWYQAFHYLRPFALVKTETFNHMILLSNYFKVALRLLRKEKAFSIINLAGLTMGISCGLFITLWINDELQYNNYLEDGDRVCAVLTRESETNGETNTYTASPYGLKKVLQEKYPIVEKATITSQGNWRAFELNHELVEWTGVDASPEFFELFEIPLIQGSFQKMYSDPNVMVVSEAFAKTYYGENWQTQNIIGTTIKNDLGKTVEIIGVFRDFPSHSTIRYDFVVPFDNLVREHPNLNRWDNNSGLVYVKINDLTSIEEANAALANAITDHRDDQKKTERQVFLQPFEDMYLYNRYENGTVTGGRIEYVRLLSVAVLLVMLLACINFMNLSTARSGRRAKETGVRKVLGALRSSLTAQFLLESFLLTTCSIVLALILVACLLPQFNALTEKQIALAHFLSPKHIGLFFCLLFILGLVTGIYPALYLSSVSSLRALKGILTPTGKTGLLRKSLVVVQLAITVVMIIGAITIYQQVSFIQSKNIGLDRSNLIRSFNYDMDPTKEYQTFRTELLNQPGIENVTITNQLLINLGNSTSSVKWSGKLESDDLEFYFFDANPDFLPTTKIQLKEGRNFSWERKIDSANYIINETAQKLMGMEHPVGQTISIFGKVGKIIGVVKDFHNASLHQTIEPLIIRNRMTYSWMILTRAKPGMNQEAVKSLEKVFHKYNPKRTFWYHFMDDVYNQQYQSELLIRDLSWYFTLVTSIISLFGLFSLVAYTTERRIKEVGIRKVLGASIPQILQLLSQEYLLLLGIALLIAIPCSALIMTGWLNGFAYRIHLSWWVFAAAGLSSLLVSWITLSFHTVRAARTNPVNCLRDE